MVRNMLKLKLTRAHALIFGVVLIGILWFVWDARVCDPTTQKKHIKTPEGKFIPKYVFDTKNDVHYGKLIDKNCSYVNDKIECPDVRHLGNYVNRQSNLVIARMHAVLHLILKKYKIDYWIICGSLLASQRDGILIPWDADGDIGIMLKDYQELIKYIRLELPDDMYFEDGSDNVHLKRISTNSKIRDKKSCLGHCLRTGFCTRVDSVQIDIFVFEKTKSNPLIIEDAYGYYRYALSDVFPTKPINLEGLVLSGPNNPSTILRQKYGDSYMTPPPLSGRCGYAGYIAIPWYSCEYIESLPRDQRTQILKDSMDHGNIWYWYMG